jgi:alkylation response protein AidB-like acyl-CoA dehydrogenase
MNLTEPQAGSDLSMVRTRAEPQPDGSYKLFGTKIFITYGEHDMADNIVHLVLARVSGAPEGVKGISLFICPKFMPNPDGPTARATTCTASASSTSWASRPAPPPCCSTATTAAPWAT